VGARSTGWHLHRDADPQPTPNRSASLAAPKLVCASVAEEALAQLDYHITGLLGSAIANPAARRQPDDQPTAV
jgi:hypothetical protein